jgi:hypothetical protein
MPLTFPIAGIPNKLPEFFPRAQHSPGVVPVTAVASEIRRGPREEMRV